jgi:hypothetical protein
MSCHYQEDFIYAKIGSNRQKIDNVGQKILSANELDGVLDVYFSWCQMVRILLGRSSRKYGEPWALTLGVQLV